MLFSSDYLALIVFILERRLALRLLVEKFKYPI